MATNNNQRIGSVSNSHVGRDFETVAIAALADGGIEVVTNFAVPVGIGGRKKEHKFDLGAENPPVLVECKSHTWTEGGRPPSAKMTVWNEAMYYFLLAPGHYRKILFILHNLHPATGESLSAYYIRRYSHLIPSGVELWEYNEGTKEVMIVFTN